MKTSKAIKKWNLTVQKSPDLKIVNFTTNCFTINQVFKCFVLHLFFRIYQSLSFLGL